MARVLSFLIRYFSNYYTLHRSDLAARAAPLDPHLVQHLDGGEKAKLEYEKTNQKPFDDVILSNLCVCF